MRFLDIYRSLKKSIKIKKLQKTIAPSDDFIEHFLSDLKTGRLNRKALINERAFGDYLDICESDEDIVWVMSKYGWKRENLVALYMELKVSGLGQWVKGHYVALSTLAYFEPFLFTCDSISKGKPLAEIASLLLDYWEDKIPNGELIKNINIDAR